MTGRRVLAVALLTATLSLTTAPAFAAPPVGVPDPTDCHSMQRFLHIETLVDCDGPPPA